MSLPQPQRILDATDPRFNRCKLVISAEMRAGEILEIIGDCRRLKNL
jgi:hypothetical protein